MKRAVQRLGGKRSRLTALVVVVAALAVAVSVGTSRGNAAVDRASADSTLVVDTSFVVKSVDPQREFEPTSSIVDHAAYDTLLTFKGAGTTPIPSLATTFKVSNGAKLFVFHLRKNVVFSDGTQLTSRDVLFSFRRLQNLNSSGSFLLTNVTVSAPDKWTVVLKSSVPNPALTRIVANAALGVVNSTVVKAHGGTDAKGADKKDKAEQFLDNNSQGSGPYTIQQFSNNQQIVLVANPRFWGRKPPFQKVVIRN
ncbi:MAG: ABC transporter substrate-binding protein, partial [Gaiellaceae bacterium]